MALNRSPQALSSLAPAESGEVALRQPRLVYIPYGFISFQEPEIMNGPALPKGDIEDVVSAERELGEFLKAHVVVLSHSFSRKPRLNSNTSSHSGLFSYLLP